MKKDKIKLKKAERRNQRKAKYAEFETGKDTRIKKIVESVARINVKNDNELIKENDRAIQDYHRRIRWAAPPKRKE